MAKKRYTEGEVTALIDQAKASINYHKQLRDDEHYAQSSLKRLDDHIATLTAQRERLAHSINNADQIIANDQAKLKKLRSLLVLARADSRVQQLMRLYGKVSAIQKELA